MIGSIIGSHCEKRDEAVWVFSIRGEKPDEDIDMKGIQN